VSGFDDIDSDRTVFIFVTVSREAVFREVNQQSQSKTIVFKEQLKLLF